MAQEPIYDKLAVRAKQLESEHARSQLLQSDNFTTALHMLAEQSEDMIYYYHVPSKTFVFSNKKALENYFSSKKALEMQGFRGNSIRMPAMLIHAEDIQTVRSAQLVSLRPHCSSGEVEYRILDVVQGEWMWWHDKWVVIRDKSGTAISIMGVIRDETGRKQAEKELRESQALYRTVFEATGTATMLIEDDMTLSLVNAEFERLSGFKKSEVEGIRKWTEFVGQEDLDRLLTYHQSRRIDADGPLKSCEFRMLDRNGCVKYVLAFVVMVPGTRKSVASVIDIAHQKKAEEALRESQERFRALFDRSLNCVYIHDFEGKFIDANLAVLNLLGYEREEILSLDFASLISQDQVPTAMKTLDELRKTGSQRGLNEYKLRRKDGQYVDIETKASVVYHEDKPYAILGIARDITERKRMESILKKREEELEVKSTYLEEANISVRALLRQRELEKKEMETDILSNVSELIMPFIEKLKSSPLGANRIAYVNVLETNLKNIATPFLRNLTLSHFKLTPSEIQVANFVKNGRTTKEMAELMNVSTGTIDFHRHNIRMKLGIRNKKTNLRSCLLSLS